MVLLIFECAVMNAVSQKVMDLNKITTCLVSFLTVLYYTFLYWQVSIVVFRQFLVLFGCQEYLQCLFSNIHVYKKYTLIKYIK